ALVRDQVEIPLPVACLRVREAVELVRQRPKGLRDHPPRGDRNREFACTRSEQRSADLEKVAEVDQVQPLEVLETVAAEMELDAAGLVAQIEEGCLAHDALRGHAA